MILLSHSESQATPEHIQKCLPDQQGRYHVYRFKHEFNQQNLEPMCKMWKYCFLKFIMIF